ncbi:LysR family transcriptional regulator [Paracoccus sp. MBLB3053]|uniref:LysR family transcriptional regulator n=1 Tax=Paracoccus aurantius TaxID=3073814 RepID=A0ABU2HYY9_9RHOB|nr:LysR family transcriptional regulator [Paracoccus sp. MBLB3053]MDS9470279.1 LysR family transcriptional regulator [Paracoccus sp. MBLB3053]
METLANLESFVKSAESASFSEAARRLSLTPAAVSRNVAMLERNLGVRLFQRSTRKLVLTEAGERFLQSIGGNLDALQTAIADVSSGASEPAGVLKVSLSPTFGAEFILPLLPELMRRHPLIRPEWHFENRHVDLAAEGYDVAIGAGFELTPGMVARTLAPAHIIAVAAPGYTAGRTLPSEPEDLSRLDGIAMRSLRTGRLRQWVMRNVAGTEKAAPLPDTIILNDPAAMREAAKLGLGVALLAVPDVLRDLENGSLIRLLPHWFADAGAISLYYVSRTLLPAKTRVFVDLVAETFSREQLAERFAGSLASEG